MADAPTRQQFMLRGLIGRLRCREQYGLSDEEWRQAILACVREAAAC